MSKRKLYIITDSFPYGKGEKTFVLPEIEILKNDFAITIVLQKLWSRKNG